MMTYKERIEREKGNLNTIILHNDGGLFYNLYERSAYAFHTRIKPFKVHVKSLKDLASPYVTVGVPACKMNDYLNDLELSREHAEYLIVKLKDPIDENAFLAWKNHLIEQKEKNQQEIKFPLDYLQNIQSGKTIIIQDDDLSLLRSFLQEMKTLNLAAMTPMEAMLSLNNFQIKLKNINL